MAEMIDILWQQANQATQTNRPADAVCYLAEIVSTEPTDRQARLWLALALGYAGNPTAALDILRQMAERLAHEGRLLEAIIVARHGLENAGDNPTFVQVLERIHIRGARAKAGNLPPAPPPRPGKGGGGGVSAVSLIQSPLPERLARAAQVGLALPPPEPPVELVPLPLFGELETPAFIEVVKRLRYFRVAPGTRILREGEPGDSVLILASGQASVIKGSASVAQLGAGAVLGEMGMITRAPRSATVIADTPVEYFELPRSEVVALAKLQPKVADELSAYCRGRLLQNLLRNSPLFSRFDEATRLDLLRRFQPTTYEPDETIIVQGQPASGLYLIASGEVDVRIANEDGDMVTVATLGPGEVVGEISLLRNQPASAYVTARNTVGGLVLPTEEFYRVLQEHPGVHEYLETITAERLKTSRDVVEGGVIDADDLIIL